MCAIASLAPRYYRNSQAIEVIWSDSDIIGGDLKQSSSSYHLMFIDERVLVMSW